MVRASPAAVSIHGGQAVNLLYDGELPSNFAIALDGTVIYPVDVQPLDHTFSFTAPTHAEGYVTLAVYDIDTSELVDQNPFLLSYYKLPGAPRLQFVPAYSNFDFPVHSELNDNCARVADLLLTNDGDEPFSVMYGATDNPAFMFQPVSCAPVGFRDECSMRVCYNQKIGGSYSATAVAVTEVGDSAVGVQATTLTPIPNLDGNFGGDGGVVIHRAQPWYDGRGIVRPDGGLETWTQSNAIAVEVYGAEHDYDVATTVHSVTADWLRGMRAGPTGSGIYALIGDSSGGANSAILHFTDAGAPDFTFSQIDLPNAGTPITYYRGLELVGSRILAIGDFGVLAIKNGSVDTTYGTSGATTFPTQFRGESAVDSQGNLYVVLDDRVLKLTAAGAIDNTFAYTGTPRAITIDAADNVFVADGTHATRLAATGSGVALYSGTTTVDDVAVDSLARVYVVSGGVIRRFSFAGALEAIVGFNSARSVACPPSGGCYLLGVNVDTTPDPLPTYFENYVLKQAN